MAKNKSDKSAFIAPMAPSPQRNSAWTNSQAKTVAKVMGPTLTGKIVKAVRFVDAVAPGVIQDVQDAILVRGQEAVVDGINKIRNGKPVSRTNSPTPAPLEAPVFQGGPKSNNISYALSGAPAPKPVNLNSGVKPDTFVSDYMSPVENVCSPLHLTSIVLGIPISITHPMYLYFMSNVVFNIQAKAQQVSTFLLDITPSTGIFCSANILAAINDGIYALQVYFYYSAILSYDSDSRNRNSGMDALRQLVDAQTLSDYIQLGKRLEDTPIPPRVVQWVRYMSSNFKSGNNAGSPLLRLAPNQNFFTGTRPATSYCATALTNLSRNNNLGVWNLMRKAFPKWRIGKLADIPVTPLYDKQFITIFANLQNACRPVSSQIFSNTVSATNGVNIAVPYNSYTNHLDGLAFAMSASFDGSILWPGLVAPATATATYPDNRYSYYSVSGVSGFYPVYNYPFLGMSRQETTTQLQLVSYTTHLSGTDRCQNVTGAALLNSAQEVIDFMFETRTTLRLGVQNTFSRNT